MNKVKWRSVPGFEGRYMVSNRGEVYSIMSFKMLKPHVINGYYRVNLQTEDGNKETEFVHVLVARAFIPNPENLPLVSHLDWDKKHNDDSNLKWASFEESRHRATKEGRLAKKLTIREVLAIRDCRGRGESCSSLADKYCVTASTIYMIVRRETWKEI